MSSSDHKVDAVWVAYPMVCFAVVTDTLGLVSEHVIRQLNYKEPTPIQCQAIPAIMSGRDIIGVAKTGSGKTVAFLLPMLRHLKAQRPIGENEGPIAIIMTPTRELAMQIHNECKRFTAPMKLRVC